MTAAITRWWRRLSVSPALIGLTRRRVALQWQMRGRPLPPPHVVKQLAILRYQRARRFRTFVETGTFTGEMVAAMRPHFDRIISIEMAAEIYQTVRPRFAGDAHVGLLLGDSAIVLPKVLATLDHPALFWLDGHFMGAGTARAQEDSPVRAELGALLPSPRPPPRGPDRRCAAVLRCGGLSDDRGAAGVGRARAARLARAGRGRHHPVLARRGRCRILALVEHPPPFQRVRPGRSAAASVSSRRTSAAGRRAGELALRDGVRRRRRRPAGAAPLAPPRRRERDADAAAAVARSVSCRATRRPSTSASSVPRSSSRSRRRTWLPTSLRCWRPI